MNNVMRRISALLLGLVLLAGGVRAQQTTDAPATLTFDPALGDGPVYVVPIEGTIDNALARYIDRALADAAAADVSAVVFHVDTFGGLVDAADQIRTAILEAPVPTVAFIDKNAASAGALISYAADRIAVAPGASMGAATAVNQTGEKAPEKIQSYMRGLMRSTAEANGRDPRIAEAMVDESIAVPDVIGEGQLLTLSASEALRLNVADASAANLDALLEGMDVGERQIVQHRATRVEQLLRFLASPVLQSILMLMMLGGLYFELQTPGVGFAGSISVVGAALFFAPHYLMGLVESWEIVLFVIGVLLIVIEILIIPGFGVPGITGLVLVVGSLGMALIANVGLSFPEAEALGSAFATMAVTMVLLVVLVVSLSRVLPRSARFNRLVLANEPPPTEADAAAAEEEYALEGRTGVTLTPLRPAGAVDVDGRRVDVVTAGEFVAAGVRVEIVRVRGSRVEVRAVPDRAPRHETSTS